MDAYKLFKMCMMCQGRAYNKEASDFKESKHFNFFYMLLKYLKNELKLNDKKIKQYIEVCVAIHGKNFDPWKLNSNEYFEEFKSWYKINSSSDAYINSVKESIKNVVKFCKQKKIKKLEEYISHWGVTHYISGTLNENVAFVLGLHNLALSKPEKFMVRRLLKNVPMIQERIQREGRLRTILESEIQQAKEMLFWISDSV